MEFSSSRLVSLRIIALFSLTNCTAELEEVEQTTTSNAINQIIQAGGGAPYGSWDNNYYYANPEIIARIQRTWTNVRMSPTYQLTYIASILSYLSYAKSVHPPPSKIRPLRQYQLTHNPQ